MSRLLILFALVPFLLFSQTRKQRKALQAQKKADQQIISNLKSHIEFFANKNFQESAASAKDGQPALQYISNQFTSIGLQPKGNNGYIQQFKIDEGRQIQPATFLKVNGTALVVKKEYFPLSFSASKSVTGMPAMALKERGVPWFADLKEWLEENTKNTDFNIFKTIQSEAGRAASKGATALFLYNTSNIADKLRFNIRDKTSAVSIPVIYITSAGYNKYFMDNSQMLDIELNVDLKETTKNAYNIAGYIDNRAASNIIIATPYDRYYQDDENVAGKQKPKGADDAVSGTSMLIELARMLYSSKAKNNNYTFIAYSGEDSLSRDSKWISNYAISTTANYIINLDQVGRYDENKKLLIESYGLSADWIESIKPLADKTLEVNFDNGSTEGRDTSIYTVKIPVLNFLTGTHGNSAAARADSTINYEGELQIARFIYRLIEATDTKGKLAFSNNSPTALQGIKTTESAISAKNTIRP